MSVHGPNQDLTIVLHNGHRYELPYKYLDELMRYFVDAEAPLFQFETTDGFWVYLQKNAIAAIETSGKRDHPKVHGFAVIGEIPSSPTSRKPL